MSAAAGIEPRPVRLRLVAGVLALLAGAATFSWLQPSDPDDFYTTPDAIEEQAPGALLRSDRLTEGLPDGVRGWRILFRSTDGDGDATAVSGMVLVPDQRPEAPRPLVSLVHGTTGVAPQCAPSLSPRPLARLPGAQQVLDAGYAVAATDLPGLGTPGPHPYLIGDVSAHAVLDAARAATALAEVDPDRHAIWGFSQGGHAALFAGAAAPDYAPELALDGVVAFAPPTDLTALIDRSEGTLVGTLLLVNAAVAWSELHDDLHLEDLIAEGSVEDARALGSRCLDGPSLPVAALGSIQLRRDVEPLDPERTGRWLDLLEQNSPTAPLAAPLLVLQGEEDFVIRPEVTQAHVAERCARGEQVELRMITAAEHLTVVWRSDQDALEWTEDRFAERPLTGGC